MTQPAIAVVTGANGGIGFETARGLARAGMHVVLVARTAARAAAVTERLRLEQPQALVSSEAADFASLAQVDALAMRLRERWPQIDVLINNAGLFSPQRHQSDDGYELTFAVNYLAPFLLTTRLLDRLRAAPAGHVINVSSAAYRFSRLKLDQLSDPLRYSSFRAYGNSKLAQLLFTHALAARQQDSPLRVNSLHPGYVDTSISITVAGPVGAFLRWAQRFAVTPARGAETSIWLATSPDAATLNDSYVVNRRVQRLRGRAADRGMAEQLWRASQQWCATALYGAQS